MKMTMVNLGLKRLKKTVTAAYLKKKLFAFKLQESLLPSSTDTLTAVQRQTAVTAYF